MAADLAESCRPDGTVLLSRNAQERYVTAARANLGDPDQLTSGASGLGS